MANVVEKIKFEVYPRVLVATLHEKCPNTEFFLVRIFPHSEYLYVFSPNAGKYGPEKTVYLDAFHVVQCPWLFLSE